MRASNQGGEGWDWGKVGKTNVSVFLLCHGMELGGVGYGEVGIHCSLLFDYIRTWGWLFGVALETPSGEECTEGYLSGLDYFDKFFLRLEVRNSKVCWLLTSSAVCSQT